jgi:hypothetical protein
MAKADLHEFKEDLKNKPGPGSDAPPRTVRASDLDGNFKKVMLIESDDVDPVPYEVEYTEDGTMLKNLKQLPDGESLGDIAYYDPEAGNNGAGAWRVLRAPEQDGKIYALTIQSGALKWLETEDCNAEE